MAKSDWIRAGREAKGWSQTTLGEKVGASQGQISQWERGAKEPGADHLGKLKGLLGGAGGPSLPTGSVVSGGRFQNPATGHRAKESKTIAASPARNRASPRTNGAKGGTSFQQAFKNIDDVLWKEAGCTTELDYTEQTSWLLFLKYLDALEQDRAMEAELEGRRYTYILDPAYRWETWAAPKGKDGKLDHNRALTGDDLRDFVDQKLFPYLHGFKQRARASNTIEYKIGEIFGEIKNKIRSGYNLREIIDHIDELRFRSQTEKHELSALYEEKIQRMGNAGRNGGEYYTPRPLIRAIVQVVKPRVGERIADRACGSAGFLCEAFDYLRSQPNLTTADLKTLQERTFYGQEKKSLAYVIAVMNMILHGIDAPNIVHTNTLAENLADIQEKDRVDVVMANPPFGGKERKEVQQNFPIRTGETAFLFLQHFIKVLKAGGRAGIVIKNTFLSNTDNAAVSLRRQLLETCNLHTVLDCPQGTFQGAGVKTVVLFFEKGAPTRKVWYYQLDPGRTLGKTTPLNDVDLKEFVALQKTFADSPKSWSVDAAGIDKSTWDLSVKNPNGGEAVAHRSPQAILDEIAALDAESARVLATVRGLLG
ncbi:MAG: N-6 DNA methylase [Deferrisomatales bacterium]